MRRFFPMREELVERRVVTFFAPSLRATPSFAEHIAFLRLPATEL
jgi:hypothetical protein